MAVNFKDSIIFWLIPLTFLALWYFRDIVLPFIVGIFFGVSVQTLSLFLSYKIKTPYYLNVFLIFALFIFLVSLLFYLIFNVVISGQIPQLWQKFLPYLMEFQINDINLGTHLQKFLLQYSPEYLPSAFVFLYKIFGGFFSFVLIFIISVYTSLRKNFSEEIAKLFPEKYRQDYLKIFFRIKRRISFWFFGQIVLMVSVGLVVYLAMVLLKIPYASLIGLSAGILEIVPVLGPIISLAVASIVTIVERPEMIGWVLGIFVLIQQLENNLLVPLVMKKATTINPILIILGVVLGGKIGGVLGIIVVLPVLAILVEILNYYKTRK